MLLANDKMVLSGTTSNTFLLSDNGTALNMEFTKWSCVKNFLSIP